MKFIEKMLQPSRKSKMTAGVVHATDCTTMADKTITLKLTKGSHYFH